MRVSVMAPVKNEEQFIGFSIMDCLESVHEIIYACADSTDGTDELLAYIKKKYAGDKLKILRAPEFNFNPHNMADYNNAFNVCIKEATGDSVFFKHPDMICSVPIDFSKVGDESNALAFWTFIDSYAKDFTTRIVKGRTGRWKNIHRKQFGLHYYGEYGSVNEDFYHSDITGKSHRFYGGNFNAYPFQVSDSGIKLNHYCELKDYERRYEKMRLCLKTLFPDATEEALTEMAKSHPRVTLENASNEFGSFEFKKVDTPLPAVFSYKEEFENVLGRKL